MLCRGALLSLVRACRGSLALAGCSGGMLWQSALAGCSGGEASKKAGKRPAKGQQEASKKAGKRPGRGQQEARKRPARGQQDVFCFKMILH